MKNFQFSIFNFQLAISLLLVPGLASAFSAQVIVDTGRENINALEATIRLPRGVDIDKIYDGNSAILFWIEAPSYDRESRTIFFSGVTPTGFGGARAVFSFSGELTAADLPKFVFSDVRALKSDGSGTSIPVRLSLRPAEIALDTVPPELFNPIISSSPEAFDNRPFLSFATQDKGSGVERYEAAFSWLLPPGDDEWREAQSPLILSRLDTFKKIYIRAIDNAGNYQTASTAGPYHYTSLFASTIILICILLYLRRRLPRY